MSPSSPLPRTVNAIQRGITDRLQIGAQLYVSLDAQPVADLAIGEARPGAAMRTDTLMPWRSAGKPLMAVAIAEIWQRGQLDLDDPVARHIPAFAQAGKGSITIRHLLTHTAGFRRLVEWKPIPWDELVARLCAAPIERDWIPGHKAGYHVDSSWIILGELIRRLDGRPCDQYVQEMIFGPLEMGDCFLCMSPRQYRAYGDRMAQLQVTGDPDHVHPLHADAEAFAAVCRPGSSARGPVRQLGRFYEMLLNRGRNAAGDGILSAQSVEALVARHRTGMYDLSFRHTIDWGLGFQVNSNFYGVDTVPYGFGPFASPRTFGHGGRQTCSAFCDPEHRLVVAISLNGTPGEAKHDTRMRAIHSAIYEDLELVPR